MSVDMRVRGRILNAVADIRKAAARHNENAGVLPTASVHHLPVKARPVAKESETNTASELHLMLPKPHTSIW
jgi:hypothetical protein